MDWASDLARKRHVETDTEAPPRLYIHQRRMAVGQSYRRDDIGDELEGKCIRIRLVPKELVNECCCN